MPVLENLQETSPRMASASTSYNYSTPISPIQASSPPHYEYDYALQSGLIQANSQQWNGNGADRRGSDMFPSGSQDPSLYGNFGPYSTPLDGGFTAFEATSDMNVTGLSTTPPTASFNASGLPFHGLDFIRNYHPGGYPTGDQDSLWQSYDPGAFGYDPDLPFTLGDITLDGQDATVIQ